MGIRFYCPDCGRRLNIKAFLAGKRGICPHCDARVRIPLESQIPANAPKFRPVGAAKEAGSPIPSAAVGESTAPLAELTNPVAPESSADPIAEAPESVWYVRPPSGGQYGPARGEVMRKWLAEGRVSADSMVWREGWSDWQTAGPLFPALQPDEAKPNPASEPRPSISVAEHSTSKPAPSFVVQNEPEQDISASATARRKGRKRSLAPLLILGSLIVVLVAVTVVIVVQQS